MYPDNCSLCTLNLDITLYTLPLQCEVLNLLNEKELLVSVYTYLSFKPRNGCSCLESGSRSYQKEMKNLDLPVLLYFELFHNNYIVSERTHYGLI